MPRLTNLQPTVPAQGGEGAAVLGSADGPAAEIAGSGMSFCYEWGGPKAVSFITCSGSHLDALHRSPVDLVINQSGGGMAHGLVSIPQSRTRWTLQPGLSALSNFKLKEKGDTRLILGSRTNASQNPSFIKTMVTNASHGSSSPLPSLPAQSQRMQHLALPL